VQLRIELSGDLVDSLDALSRESGLSLSQLIEGILQHHLSRQLTRAPRSPLPSFDSGGLLVDVSDRAALYDLMDPLENSRNRNPDPLP
jgi:hypothetical protein